MNITSLVGLPWKLIRAYRSARRDLGEILRILADLAPVISALRSQEMGSLRETLIGEIREQGLLMETAARFSSRAAAETKLRSRLAPPETRERGVSVLITCWNHAGFLSRSIGSATAALDFLPVPGEVLILDDASRDGSREVAFDLARLDERIRVIDSDENLGLPRARNVLLSQARFEHAMILDSDNQLVASGIAPLYTSACQSGAVLAYGNIVRVDQSGSVIDVIGNERASANLFKENWIDAMAMVKTDRLLALGGYDCQWLHGLEDWELNQRLFTLGEPILFVPVLIGMYTTLPSSMLREAPLSSRYRRGLRIFGSVNESHSARFRAGVHHPAVGTIWTSPAWSSNSPVHLVRPVPRPVPAPANVLVVTSGGVYNYGDDAILLSTLERLKRIRPDWLATVVSDGSSCPPLGLLGAWAGTCKEFIAGLDPQAIRHGCQGDLALVAELSQWIGFGSSTPRTDMKSFDLVLFAGGGNLNVYWPELIAWRTAIAAAARSAGVPCLLTGQGVGPVSDEIVPMLSFLAGEASAVATRDPLSARLLREIAPGGPPIEVVGDDALGLRCDGPAVARDRLKEIGVPIDRPLLAFHARVADYVGFSREELNLTARQVDEFAAENGYAVVAVPINMHPRGPEADLLSDLAYSERRRAPWHVINLGGDVAAIAGVIKVCAAVLTHSYHVAIFALESRIPALLFAGSEYYELKAQALQTAFGIPVSITASGGLAGSLIADQLQRVSHSSWAHRMSSFDVDAWLDANLPQRPGGKAGMGLARFGRRALGIAG